MEIKLNIGDSKTGKTLKKEVKDDDAKHFLGKKVGEVVKGELMDLSGYEFEITGGSDHCGFPMRKDVMGIARKRVLITGGVGSKYKRTGMRRRRTVAGNTVYEKTAQLNLKITKHGKNPLFDEKKDAPAEETPKDA
jgi:small subunit ribosomal protein S6e